MAPRRRQRRRQRLARVIGHVVQSSAMAASSSEPPLAGIKVVDMTQVIAGPYTGSQLADMGADVCKIENNNGVGDSYRLAGTAMLLPTGEVFGASFGSFNRGKKSIAVDATTPEGIQIIKDLVRSADVFLQNFRPGVAAKLGLAWEDLRQINHRLVYVSISGFGQSGPLVKEPVYDPIIQARSGLVHLQSRVAGHAKLISTLIHDKTTAMTAARDVTAALYARHRTGRGQHIELSMLDVALQFLWGEAHANYHYFVGAEEGGEKAPGLKPLPGGGAVNVTKNIIPETFAVHSCQDGFVSAINLARSKHWAAFLAEYDTDGTLAADPRFASGTSRVLEHLDEWVAAVDVALSAVTVEEVLRFFQRQDIPGAPVLDFEQSFRQPQVQHMHTVVERTHLGLGGGGAGAGDGMAIREIRQAGIFSDTPLRVGVPAPLFGQHTEEILAGLGMPTDRIRQLEADGVVSTGIKRRQQ